MSTVGEPGTHGAGMAGTHGIGVSTPSAAAVAAATIGLARLEHIPKVAMFTNGLLSMMVAAGRPATMVRPSGSTFSAAGAAPKLHMSWAPLQRSWPIAALPRRPHRTV